MWRHARRSAFLLAGERRRFWAILVPLAIAAGLIETVATANVFVLVKLASDPASLSRLPIVSTAYAALPWREGKALVLSFTAFVAAFFILRNALLAALVYVESKALGDAVAGLSARLLAAYLGAPYAFHFRRSSADLLFYVTTGVEYVVNAGLGSSVLLISEVLVAAGLIVVLMIAAPLVTVVTAGSLAALLGATVKITKDRSRRWGAERDALAKEAIESAQQSLGGLKEVKVLGREPFFLEAFAGRRRAFARVWRRRAVLGALPRLFVETGFVFGVLLVVTLVTLGAANASDVVPLLGLYAYAGFRLIPSANRMLLHVDNIRATAATAARIEADLRALEAARTALREEPEPPPLVFADRLVLEHVSYSYDGAERGPVLTEVDLAIARGESVGIVGPTGAGKSTLADLILGLIAPTGGRITVDGADLQAVLRSWQRKIGYVPQTIFLTDDTIRRNVALGLPDAEIDEAKLAAAVRLAQLDEFVGSLADGLATRVGERGVRLSGGQRQRIGIARALYAEPELLVFDEATSALDNQTERELTRAIERLQGAKTLIIIAHRLTTVRGCDRLVFLRGGRVADAGPFEELRARNAEFREMAALAEIGGGEV